MWGRRASGRKDSWPCIPAQELPDGPVVGKRRASLGEINKSKPVARLKGLFESKGELATARPQLRSSPPAFSCSSARAKTLAQILIVI
jgi:hypothetical protein